MLVYGTIYVLKIKRKEDKAMIAKNCHIVYVYPEKMKAQQSITKSGTNITLPDSLKIDDIVGALPLKGVYFSKDGTALKGYATTSDESVTLTTSDVVFFLVSNDTYEA